jgi:hypothetical protein
MDCMHAGGDLYEELKRHGGHLSEERVARDIIQPCLFALAYLHQKVEALCYELLNKMVATDSQKGKWMVIGLLWRTQ